MNSVTPHIIDEWKCEKCEKKGCVKQQLIGTFPKVMVFHVVNPDFSSVEYSSILSLNKNQYALVGVCCFNGGHWWSYGRNMPPGSDWYTLNDRQVTQHGPREFPLSEKMRVLIYYRLDK
jgi:ubiquitin C-terminal hydrolase